MAQHKTKKKAAHRGHNEGSIYFRNDTGKWGGLVTTGYKEDGSPIRKSISGETRKDVAEKVAALVAEVNLTGRKVVSAQAERNFESLCREWFDLKVAPGLASSTAERDRRLIVNHIFPVFGDMDVRHIEEKMLQAFINDKREEFAQDTVGKMKTLLVNFFAHALRKRFIGENPMLDVSFKRSRGLSKAQVENVLRPEIRQQVIEWVADNPILKPIVLTFIFTGLRPQELIPLEWVHVDLNAKSLQVKQALNRTAKMDAGWNVTERGFKVGDTKTPTSVRTVVLPDNVVRALMEWKAYCEANDVASKYVFPNTENGEMRSKSGLRSLLDRFIRRHKLETEKISFYTFRHTYATILLEKNVNPKVVAALMGHAKASFTLDRYSHVVNPAVYKSTAQMLDDAHNELSLK